MSMRPCVFSARISRLNELDAAEKTNPPMLVFDETRPTPRLLSPWKPTTPGSKAWLLPTPAPRLLAPVALPVAPMPLGGTEGLLKLKPVWLIHVVGWIGPD